MWEKQRGRIGVVVYHCGAVNCSDNEDRIGAGMLLLCFLAGCLCLSVFVCVHYNHVHTILSGHVGRELSPSPPPTLSSARSVGCKVTGKTQEHRHRHCRCQVCWGGNCQCGGPAASVLEDRGLERKWGAGSGEVCLPRGPAQYLWLLFIRFPSVSLHHFVFIF